MRTMRKRKKAENSRLLESQRRTKERLEDMRETEKKVHAAYKKAMLKFHPDRASKTDDIRKQVEAEETCKLLSSVKEKFCSTSWR
ncbi:dentin sialophosphoprotein [Trifolium pratense]|uniref:Dentin sialophosphoprotein n=1 Tax=Trifolium pratense TaxID=57577 RepID=A0A2K3PL97_TRIPR|nr:dentin sialophosphoprotein [Trifolium pratense]